MFLILFHKNRTGAIKCYIIKKKNLGTTVVCFLQLATRGIFFWLAVSGVVFLIKKIPEITTRYLTATYHILPLHSSYRGISRNSNNDKYTIKIRLWSFQN